MHCVRILFAYVSQAQEDSWSQKQWLCCSTGRVSEPERPVEDTSSNHSVRPSDQGAREQCRPFFQKQCMWWSLLRFCLWRGDAGTCHMGQSSAGVLRIQRRRSENRNAQPEHHSDVQCRLAAELTSSQGWGVSALGMLSRVVARQGLTVPPWFHGFPAFLRRCCLCPGGQQGVTPERASGPKAFPPAARL